MYEIDKESMLLSFGGEKNKKSLGLQKIFSV